MPEISNKKRKFIKKNFKHLSIEELVRQTGLKPNVVRSLIDDYNKEMTKQGNYSPKKLVWDKDSLKKQSRYVILTGAIVIFLFTFIVYIPALKNDFVTWDDPSYIYENTNIHSLDTKSIYWMLTSFDMGNWHPLTWISHTIDYAYWNLNPLGHHLTNIILHGLNTLLVFLFVIQLMMKVKEDNQILSPSKAHLSIPAQALIVASITALLFGLHPLHVESVAWAAERKDLLCAFFFILTLLCYLSYTSSVVKKHRCIWFITCLFLFIFALMSKPMAVTLPVILILLDIYPLKRMSLYPGKASKKLSVFMEKIPFFALSISASIITVMAQKSGEAIRSLEEFHLDFRLLNAIRSLVFYLEKMIVPVELVPFYPFPKHIYWLDLPYLLSALLVLAITGFCLWMVKNRKYLFFIIWSYYVVTVFPVIGIIQVGAQAAADRYTYLPSLSIFLLIGIGVLWLFEMVASTRRKDIFGALLLALICFVMFLLSQLTIKQIKIWQNSETLWSHVTSAFPKSVSFAHNNLGNIYYEKGELDKAISEYNQAVSLKSNYADAYYNLGVAYADKGMLDEAISEYKKALAINPNFAEAHYNLGLDYANKGMVDEAISEYKKALDIKSDYADAHYNLGVAYSSKQMFDEAISEYKKALAIKSDYVDAHYNLGLNYGNKDMINEAISEFKRVITINPNYTKAHYNLSIAHYKTGNYKMAIVHCDEVVRTRGSVNPKLLKLLEPYR